MLTPDQWTKLQADEKIRRRSFFGNMEMPGAFTMEMPDLAKLDDLHFNFDMDSFDATRLQRESRQKAIESMKRSLQRMEEQDAREKASQKNRPKGQGSGELPARP